MPLKKNSDKTKEKQQLRILSQRIGINNKNYEAFTFLTRKSKDLYNSTNYVVRQLYIGLKKIKETPENYVKPETIDLIFNSNDAIFELNRAKILKYKEEYKDILKEIKSNESLDINDVDILAKQINTFIENKNKNLSKEEQIKPLKQLPYFSINSIVSSKEFLASFIKEKPEYKVLHSQTAQHAVFQVYQDWKSYYELNKLFFAKKLKHKPKLPRYLKKNHLNLVKFTNQQIKLRNKKLALFCKGKEILIDIPQELKPYLLNKENSISVAKLIKEIRVIPKYMLGSKGENKDNKEVHGSRGWCKYFDLEFVYDKVVIQKEIKSTAIKNRLAAIDCGLNNQIALTYNTNTKPLLIGLSEIKAFNQWYNKQKAKIQTRIKKTYKKDFAKSLFKLEEVRSNKMDNYFHLISRRVVEALIANNVETVFIGKNEGWKQKPKLRKKTKQAFVQIPIGVLLNKIKYKAEECDIRVVFQEESYTSKASAISLDEIPTYDKENKTKYEFSGIRAKGIYKDNKLNKRLHSDVNGSINIGRKGLKALQENNEIDSNISFTPQTTAADSANGWSKISRKEFYNRTMPVHIKDIKQLINLKAKQDFRMVSSSKSNAKESNSSLSQVAGLPPDSNTCYSETNCIPIEAQPVINRFPTSECK